MQELGYVLLLTPFGILIIGYIILRLPKIKSRVEKWYDTSLQADMSAHLYHGIRNHTMFLEANTGIFMSANDTKLVLKRIREFQWGLTSMEVWKEREVIHEDTIPEGKSPYDNWFEGLEEKVEELSEKDNTLLFSLTVMPPIHFRSQMPMV